MKRTGTKTKIHGDLEAKLRRKMNKNRKHRLKRGEGIEPQRELESFRQQVPPLMEGRGGYNTSGRFGWCGAVGQNANSGMRG